MRTPIAACCSSKPVPPAARSPSTCRARPTRTSCRRATTGWTFRFPRRSSADARLLPRPGACSAAPPASTPWSTCAAIDRISMAGAPPELRGGAMLRCFPTSSAAKPMTMSATRAIAVRQDHCEHRRRRSTGRCRRVFWRPASRPVFPSPPIPTESPARGLLHRGSDHFRRTPLERAARLSVARRGAIQPYDCAQIACRGSHARSPDSNWHSCRIGRQRATHSRPQGSRCLRGRRAFPANPHAVGDWPGRSPQVTRHRRRA